MKISFFDIAFLCIILAAMFCRLIPHSDTGIGLKTIKLKLMAFFALFLAIGLYITSKYVYSNGVPIDSLYFGFSVISNMFITFFYCYYIFYFLLPFILRGPFKQFKAGLARIQKNRMYCNFTICFYVFLTHMGHIGAIVMSVVIKLM